MLKLNARAVRFGFFVLAVTFFVSGSSFAYTYKNAEAGHIAELVKASLQELKDGKPTDKVQSIAAEFTALDRGTVDLEDLVELKYLMSHYRASLLRSSIAQLEKANEVEKVAIVKNLNLVQPFIEKADAEKLIASGEGTDELLKDSYRLVAKFGNPYTVRELVEGLRLAKYMGPKEIFQYKEAGFSEKYENYKWLGTPGYDLESYRVAGAHSVFMRGMQIQAGDVVLIDQGATGGINTNFAIPRSYASHMGLVVFLEYEGKTYPTFFEIAERGLRVIPLNSALSAPFSLYAEVFRPTKLMAKDFDHAKWSKELGDDVLNELAKDYYYDYNNPKIETGKEKNVVCSSHVQLFLKRRRIDLPLPVDKIHANACESLQSQFKFGLKEYVAPSSFVELKKADLTFIGVVETGQTALNTTRELVVGAAGNVAPNSLGYLFTNKKLDLHRLTWAQSIQFAKVEGLAPIFIERKTFLVEAPSKVLAFADVLGDQLKLVVNGMNKNFAQSIYDSNSYEPFSLHDKNADANFQKLLKSKMSVINAWFKD